MAVGSSGVRPDDIVRIAKRIDETESRVSIRVRNPHGKHKTSFALPSSQITVERIPFYTTSLCTNRHDTKFNFKISLPDDMLGRQKVYPLHNSRYL